MGRYVVQATWDDVPHLGDAEKKELLESYEPHLRKARAMGVPSLGSGTIYPILEDEIKCKPFPIPRHWPRCYALDVGWNVTAAVWLALDLDSNVTYLYSEYHAGQKDPVIHAQAIKERGAWIKGVIDPASRGRSQVDGSQLYSMYRKAGLHLGLAENAVQAGIAQVWNLLNSSQLKIFSTCNKWFEEFRLYRRDDNGKIVKNNDHLMDATRYAIVSGRKVAKLPPARKNEILTKKVSYDY